MDAVGVLQLALFVAVLTALTPLLGGYMARVYTGERVFLSPAVGPLERGLYRLLGVRPEAEQPWKAYARSVVVFSIVSWAALYVLLRTQGAHPLNPEGFGAVPWDVAFNTTSSFVTNTNWQFYGGETTMSYVSQMAGLAVQNFVSAAAGMAVLVAVIRGVSARPAATLGNFWVDLVRSLLYVLVPLSLLGALVLVSQGVVQTLGGAVDVDTLGGQAQTIARGPAASQVAIKQLGTNGGGFFNVNSAMPLENPTGIANALQALFILLIPAALTSTYGRMVGSRRQGWAIYGAMLVMFLGGLAVLAGAEQAGSPAQHLAGIAGGNLEGKEVRIGLENSALWATATTAASNGSVNAAMASLTGLGATVPLANMLTGEVIFGGVGSGLYGMLLFVLLAVFLAGLMVGRTPEYLGKKLGAREVKLVLIGLLGPPLLALAGTALSIGTAWGEPSLSSPGPQGFAETLYAYASQANNNGSAFAGFTGFVQPEPGNAGGFGITFADLAGGLAMIGGRFVPLLAALAVGGALAGRRVAPPGPGTFRTDTATFAALVIAVVLLVALLTFVPALLLGPVVQALTDQLF